MILWPITWDHGKQKHIRYCYVFIVKIGEYIPGSFFTAPQVPIYYGPPYVMLIIRLFPHNLQGLWARNRVFYSAMVHTTVYTVDYTWIASYVYGARIILPVHEFGSKGG